MLKALNEVLENDSSDRLDYSHFLLEKSQANTDLPFSSLLSTPE